MTKTYDFVKETKGFSITISGTKISFAGIGYGAYPQEPIAKVVFNDYSLPKILSRLSIDTNLDTITVNAVPFTGTAGQLIDSLRDTVFF